MLEPSFLQLIIIKSSLYVDINQYKYILESVKYDITVEHINQWVYVTNKWQTL